jgi:nitrite reductase/ring-hydroxylating ferredoxin subunit
MSEEPVEPTSEGPDGSAATRRTVLCGVVLAALGVGAAGCGDSGDKGSGSSGATSDEPSERVRLGNADDVPVGGAKLYAEQKVLVSQPEKGKFKGFSAVCTHQGATLDKVEGDVAVCPRHGSRFDVDSGKVAKGPAAQALPSVPVKVEKGKLIMG